jgi:hypothetical protein
VKTDELTRTQIVTCSYTDLVLQYSETILTVGNYSLTEAMIYFCRCILCSITAGVVYKGSQKRGEIRCVLEHAYEETGQHEGTSSELQRGSSPCRGDPRLRASISTCRQWCRPTGSGQVGVCIRRARAVSAALGRELVEAFSTDVQELVRILDGNLPQWRASGFDLGSNSNGDAILKSKDANNAVEIGYNGQMVRL